MAINLISKGIILNFLVNLGVVFFLIHYQFELNERLFTILLNVSLFLICMYIGVNSRNTSTSPELNGLFVGLGSSVIVFLFLAQFVELNWELNALLVTIWMFFGYVGGYAGGGLRKSRIRPLAFGKKAKQKGA